MKDMQTSAITTIKTAWRCPSNIAIVKYWGKYGNQLPCNPSLSLTLSASFTEVELTLSPKTSSEEVQLTYFFEGATNPKFESRIKNYLLANKQYFPYLNDYALSITSTNSFPHSAGIASSASAFGAIALALLDAAYTLTDRPRDHVFFQEASTLARLGSGSASRSIYGGYVMWGEDAAIANSSIELATPITHIHPNFQDLRDTILIVEDEPKKVSSSVGHSLMNDHAYAENRFKQAQERVSELIQVLQAGDINRFMHLAESEALTLHAMMMTSNDYYLLMKPGTILAIEQLLEFRKETGIPVCFTLDAGPNLHILYPGSVEKEVIQFIETKLKPTYKSLIHDRMGTGPIRLVD